MTNSDLSEHNRRRHTSYEQLEVNSPEWNELLEELKKYEIRCDTVLPEMRHLLQIDGVNCFPRGELVAISGKEKCGKTTDCRILVTALLKEEYMGIKALEKNVRVLWIDTEQALTTARAVLRGIDLMCGFPVPDDRLVYYALREYPEPSELPMLVRSLFDHYAPDIAIIDGIRDLIPDFNDVVRSAEIVHECMLLASGVKAEDAKEKGLNERPPCCVCCILHQNKSKDDSNMRGHLGSELSYKAGEVWEAHQDDDHVFTFKQTCSRTRPIDKALTYIVHSENYVEEDTGNSEEIGVPEPLVTEIGKNGANHVKKIKTKLGEMPMTQENAFRMFYLAVGDAGWTFDAMKNKFCAYWSVNYSVFNQLRKLIDDHVKSRVDENGKNLWYYNGPKY